MLIDKHLMGNVRVMLSFRNEVMGSFGKINHPCKEESSRTSSSAAGTASDQTGTDNAGAKGDVLEAPKASSCGVEANMVIFFIFVFGKVVGVDWKDATLSAEAIIVQMMAQRTFIFSNMSTSASKRQSPKVFQWRATAFCHESVSESFLVSLLVGLCTRKQANSKQLSCLAFSPGSFC